MIDVENITPVPQPIERPNGDRLTIPPYGVRSCSDDVAKQFLNERAAYVRVYSENKVPPVLIGEQEVWVANQTGSPFVPKSFQITTIGKDGMPNVVTMPNPVATPNPIQHDMQVGQGKDPYGRQPPNIEVEKDFNNPPFHIHIRAATRSKVSNHVANFLMTRDLMEGEYQKGRLIVSRPPSKFEPNESWSFADIALYGRIVDKDRFGDKDIEEVVSNSTDRRYNSVDELVNHPEVEEECRHALLRRLAYRIHDPMWALPTENGFKKVKEEGVAKRGPGRPPASERPAASVR